MSQVIKLKCAEAPLTHTNEDIAEQLRLLAERIEKGQYGKVKNMLNLFVTDVEGKVVQTSFGGPELSSRYVIGMLEEAKINLLAEYLVDD